MTIESGFLQRAIINKEYDRKLQRLKDMILLMGYHAEQMVAESMRAVVERQPQTAREVILRDDTLDGLEIDANRLCNEILALRHPLAWDLRFVTTAFKVVRDIERIGDVAVNIAERALELIQEPQAQRVIALPLMAQMVQRALSGSLEALVAADERLAETIVENDKEIADLNQQILRELLSYMLEDSRHVGRCLNLIFIAKHLERIGDHAANIAETVLFMTRVRDIHHEAAAV